LFAAEHGFQRAEDSKRPAAQRAALILRDAEHVADQLDRDGGGKIGDQIDLAARCRFRQQAIDKSFDPRLQFAQRPRRERRRQQLSHPRVIGRIVEDEACCVVLVKQAVGEIRPEVDLLVRAPGRGIAVDLKAIVVPRQEVRTIRHAVDRIAFAQREVCRIGIIEKIRAEPAHVEIGCGFTRCG
jgi:hypothetical protein